MDALYNKEEAKKRYRRMSAHEKLMEELLAINLAPALVKKLQQEETGLPPKPTALE